MQPFYERYREGGRRAETGLAGQLREAAYFNRIFYAEIEKCLAYAVVIQIFRMPDTLAYRVAHRHALSGGPRYRHIHVFVYRAGKHPSGSFFIEYGEIGPSANKGDAQRCAYDDHTRLVQFRIIPSVIIPQSLCKKATTLRVLQVVLATSR